MWRRRGVLLLAAGVVAGCAGSDERTAVSDEPADSAETDAAVDPGSWSSPLRVTYGPDASQFAELSRPDGRSRGIVVVIHGGFWKQQYDASLGRPLARSAARAGWTAWNLEYRRVGNGGGVPETLDDVAAGIDALADVPDLDLSTVVTVGHSAGGQLATWAAARGRFPRWSPERIRVSGVISQAGVLDLGAAYEDYLGGGAVAAFVGAPPGPAYDRVDPLRQVPLGVPVWCVHGEDDQTVPISQSRTYVARARAAGGTAELVPIDGDHFTVIDPESAAWARTLEILDQV